METPETFSRSRKLVIILGVNFVFGLLLTSSLINSHKAQEQALLNQARELATLRQELEMLREKHESARLRLETQRDRFITTGNLEEKLETLALRRHEHSKKLEQEMLALADKNQNHHQEILERVQLRDWENQERMSWLENRVEETHSKLDKVRSQSEHRMLYGRVMSASVRINAKSEVGSGIVVFNGRRGSTERRETYILTAFHVVKDNLASGTSKAQNIEIDFYHEGQKSKSALAKIVQVEAQQDLALLQISSEIIAQPAILASYRDFKKVSTFSKVVTVGCPLGYSPMPTHGEITSTSKTFEDQEFWMINAPTIFGNSGGGVFEEGSGALVGVLIRIAAYKNVIDVAVPHLGIVTPIKEVHTWLASTPHSFIFGAFLPKSKKPIAKSLTASSKRPSK